MFDVCARTSKRKTPQALLEKQITETAFGADLASRVLDRQSGRLTFFSHAKDFEQGHTQGHIA
jgi:hypothetical protein